MAGLQSVFDTYKLLGLLAPGIIILFVRSQFTTGRRPPYSEMVLPYMIVSVIYYALAFPLINFVLSKDAAVFWATLYWIVLIFIVPALLGLLLGGSAQKGWFRRLVQWCGFNVVHVVPTAWDWKFGRMNEAWVLVTLKDGTQFAGFCGANSFMSSDTAERDIYIERIYDIDEQQKWSSCDKDGNDREKGLLIAAGEIRTIEFWPYEAQKTQERMHDEQKQETVLV